MPARQYRKQARAEAEARTQQAILEAAVACFSAVPFERTTLAEVAERAGVSMQTLLRVYGSKEELFVQAARSIAAEVMRRREEVGSAALDDALPVLTDGYERWGDASERLASKAEDVPAIAELFDEWRAYHRDWVRVLFAKELARIQPPAVRARALTLLLVALDLGTYRRIRAEGASHEAATRAMHDLAVAILRGGPGR